MLVFPAVPLMLLLYRFSHWVAEILSVTDLQTSPYVWTDQVSLDYFYYLQMNLQNYTEVETFFIFNLPSKINNWYKTLAGSPSSSSVRAARLHSWFFIYNKLAQTNILLSSYEFDQVK